MKTLCDWSMCLKSELKLQTEIVMYWPFFQRKEFDARIPHVSAGISYGVVVGPF